VGLLRTSVPLQSFHEFVTVALRWPFLVVTVALRILVLAAAIRLVTVVHVFGRLARGAIVFRHVILHRSRSKSRARR
jgi:hypothetical protein